MSSVTLRAVSISLRDSEVWFANLDLKYEALRMTHQMTKFTRVLESPVAQFAAPVRDLALNIPKERSHDRLKRDLFRHRFLSREWHLRQLLAPQPNDGIKPIDHLIHLRSFAGQQLIPIHLHSTVTALHYGSSLNRAALDFVEATASVGNRIKPSLPACCALSQVCLGARYHIGTLPLGSSTRAMI